MVRYETLQQLLNFETNTQKLLQIAMFGQNELATKIDKQPKLKDRITIFGALTPINYDDAIALIDFRWKVAGGGKNSFEQEYLQQSSNIRKFLHRKISKLCDKVLIRSLSN